ncbi:MAG: hypothetical protein ACQ9MH_01210 [Nitrospinales bacterium]
MSSKTIILICAGISYPALVHSSIIFESPEVVVFLLGTFAILYGIYQFINSNNFGLKNGFIWICIGGSLLTTALSKNFSLYALYVPPVLITALVLFSFARTLLKDREPLVTRFAQMMTDDKLPAEIVHYTRCVTWMWTVLLTVVLIGCLALPIFASNEVWSFFTNFFNYLIIASFFIGEYIYRIFRFGRRYSLLHFVRTMSKVSFK